MKREELLKLIEKLEATMKEYYHLKTHNKFKKIKLFLLFKEKALLKTLSSFLGKFLKFKTQCTIQTFFKKNLKVYMYDKDGINLIFFGAPTFPSEISTTKFLIKNLKEDDVFYDLGANYGFYTLLAQELISIDKGEIHAFEAIPEVFSLLKENAIPYKYKNTFLNNVAISDKIGESEFFCYLSGRRSGKSSLLRKADRKEKFNKIIVKTTTLDEYIKTHKAPTVIKMDIEGSELLALKGGEKFFKENSPILVMEVLAGKYLNNSLEALNMLKEWGYKAYDLLPDGEIKEISFETFYTLKQEINFLFKR